MQKLVSKLDKMTGNDQITQELELNCSLGSKQTGLNKVI